MLCFYTGGSATWRCQFFSSENKPEENNPVTPMLKHLMMKIKSTGPITVAEYMREVLTNPVKVELVMLLYLYYIYWLVELH